MALSSTPETKVEFGSPEWMARGQEFFVAEVARRAVEIADVKFTMCEVFSAAPKHLATDDAGNLTWTIIFDHGRVDWRSGLVDNPDYTVRASYDAGRSTVHTTSAELRGQRAKLEAQGFVRDGATDSIPPVVMEIIGATHDYLIPHCV